MIHDSVGMTALHWAATREADMWREIVAVDERVVPLVDFHGLTAADLAAKYFASTHKNYHFISFSHMKLTGSREGHGDIAHELKKKESEIRVMPKITVIYHAINMVIVYLFPNLKQRDRKFVFSTVQWEVAFFVAFYFLPWFAISVFVYYC